MKVRSCDGSWESFERNAKDEGRRISDFGGQWKSERNDNGSKNFLDARGEDTR